MVTCPSNHCGIIHHSLLTDKVIDLLSSFWTETILRCFVIDFCLCSSIFYCRNIDKFGKLDMMIQCSSNILNYGRFVN